MRVATNTAYLALIALLVSSSSSALDSLELRGEVATGTHAWNSQNFAGLYYDPDENLGNEMIEITVSDGNKLDEPDGVIYTTSPQERDFKFEEWGAHKVMPFLGDLYFTGYTRVGTSPEILDECTTLDLLNYGYLTKVLLDDDEEHMVKLGDSLELAGGYAIKPTAGTDNNGILVELSMDGRTVDQVALIPPCTYVYSTRVGDVAGVPVIAVHFQEPIFLEGRSYCKVDGRWQISDDQMEVEAGQVYDKMSIDGLGPEGIRMNNHGNRITLVKNTDISLMPGVSIKTADADELRYYIYEEITNPGTNEIRSEVATGTYTWTADNFAGLFYDLDDNIKTEELTLSVTDGDMLSGDYPRGAVYETTAVPDDFEYDEWGRYSVIGLFGERYFAGYLDSPDNYEDLLFTESMDENVLNDEQLLKILVDDDTERTVYPGMPLKLVEGYELSIKTIDIDSNNVHLELTLDGQSVDRKVVSPSKGMAIMAEKTYYYKADVGDSKDLVIIAVHFKNAFRGAETGLATVDGVWQISDAPVDVSTDTEFDKMTIESVTADSILMENEDNDIALGPGMDVPLMPGIRIKTADQDVSPDEPLRFYVYSQVEIEEAG